MTEREPEFLPVEVEVELGQAALHWALLSQEELDNLVRFLIAPAEPSS